MPTSKHQPSDNFFGLTTQEDYRSPLKDLKRRTRNHADASQGGAERLDATNTVDLDETARIAESLVHDGANGIMALGTMGECATLSQNDYEAYVDCLVKTVRGRIPTFVGTTALGGHEIARRIKFVKGLGATELLLAFPCGSRPRSIWR